MGLKDVKAFPTKKIFGRRIRADNSEFIPSNVRRHRNLNMCYKNINIVQYNQPLHLIRCCKTVH